MFKKQPQLKPLSALKNSERRKLLTRICNLYNLNQNDLSSELQQIILPIGCMSGKFITTTSKGLIYTDKDKKPLWFETRNNNNDIIPSVFTVWNCPFLLPIVKTHKLVIDKLKGGADLMVPGSIPPFPMEAKTGKIVGISSIDDPNVILCVGKCLLDFTQFNESGTIGRTGRGVENYHVVDDGLFMLKKSPIPKDLKIEIPKVEEKVDENENENDAEGGVAEVIDEIEQSTAVDKDHEEVIEKEKEKDEDAIKKDKDEEEDLKTLQIDIDFLFTQSLLQVLTTNKPTTPISSSSFMNDYILKSFPKRLPINLNSNLLTIKKTSWKKSYKFLKTMERDGFLKLKGKTDDFKIISFSDKSNNEKLKNFIPYKVQNSTTANTNTTSSTSTSTNNVNSNQLLSRILYKSTRKQQQLFQSLDLSQLQYHSSQQLKQILDLYISKKELIFKPNPKFIQIDDILSSSLNIPIGKIERNKILLLLQSQCTPYYKLFRSNENESEIIPIKGSIPTVKVTTATRLGRKTVTLITNLEDFNIDPKDFQHDLRVACSGSTTLGPVNGGKPSQIEVMVQGSHVSIVTKLLIEKGLNKNWIEIKENAKGKKKKKIN